MKKGTISFRYGNGLSVNWDWPEGHENEWTVSEKEGVRNEYVGKLNREAYEVLMDRFGLSSDVDSLPIDVVRTMSPQELAQARRTMENVEGLERLTIRSDTMGYHVEL